MTINPMSYGEFIVHKAFGNKSRNVLDVSTMSYRTEELLDQTRTTNRSHLKNEARTEEEKFYKHMDNKIEKAIEKAIDEMFKGWKK